LRNRFRNGVLWSRFRPVMALVLPDRWIWDFWLVAAGDLVHVFYLQAPRSLGDANLRHANSSIGHAVSADLVHWQPVADALHPSPATAFDDFATWTGSVLRHDERWHLLYTAASHAEDGLVQRIGHAVSDDLMAWHRDRGPVLEAAPRWYAQLDRADWPDLAWRDPWLLADPAGGGFHAYLTARAAGGGDRLGRGVVARATSRDLVQWAAQPPVTAPMGFGQMEVPQVLEAGGRWYLLFSTDTGTQGEMRRAARTGTGTYYLIGDGPEGPFPARTLQRLEADETGTTYAGKLFAWQGHLCFFAWHATAADGRFVGGIGDPVPVTVRADGRLELPAAAARRTAPG